MDYKEKIIVLLKSQELSKEQKEKLENIFPELKESEDERIRKELIVFLEELSKLGENTNFDKWKISDCANWIVWLEKQGNKPQGKSALEAINEEKVDNANKENPHSVLNKCKCSNRPSNIEFDKDI